MGIGETLRDLGRYIMYYPALVPVCGSVHATIFVCHLISWNGHQADPDGWIYKTQKEMEEETGLTRAMQEEARQKLGYGEKGRRIIEQKRRGVPATMHYRIDYDRLQKLWEDHLQTRLRETSNLDSPAGNSKPTMRKTSKLPSGKGANQNAGKQQSLTTDTTTDSTQRVKGSPRKESQPDPTEPHAKRLWHSITADDWRGLPARVRELLPSVAPLGLSDGVLCLKVPNSFNERMLTKHVDAIEAVVKQYHPSVTSIKIRGPNGE